MNEVRPYFLSWQQEPGQHVLLLAQLLSAFFTALLLANTTIPATNKVAMILKIIFFIFYKLKCYTKIKIQKCPIKTGLSTYFRWMKTVGRKARNNLAI